MPSKHLEISLGQLRTKYVQDCESRYKESDIGQSSSLDVPSSTVPLRPLTHSSSLSTAGLSLPVPTQSQEPLVHQTAKVKMSVFPISSLFRGPNLGYHPDLTLGQGS